MNTASKTNTFVSIRDRFISDTRGNVAMMFGLAIVPILLFTGASVDYTRASSERERILAALDATGLALAKLPAGTALGVMQAKGADYFAASFQRRDIDTTPTLTINVVGNKIQLQATSAVKTAFMRIAGYDTLPIAVDSEVTNERKKIELALVLDNTGSMGSAGKMPALKAAVNDLLTQLQAKVVNPDDVKVSIVPFATSVKIDTNNWNAGWLRWDVTLENTSLSWSLRQPPTTAQWTGCIADRDQPWDINSAPPAMLDSRYVVAKCAATNLERMEPLTTDLNLIRTRANAMTPGGNTNVTIGLTMGMATLRNDSPLGANSSNASDVEKFLILLTDGDNTQNRWSNGSGNIDPRLSAACTLAKTSNIKIYTIRVIAGNAGLLQACATNPSMYYDVQNASKLQPVFQKIIESIAGIRITS